MENLTFNNGIYEVDTVGKTKLKFKYVGNDKNIQSGTIINGGTFVRNIITDQFELNSEVGDKWLKFQLSELDLITMQIE